MRATMRTMFKETKQKSVRGIKAGAGETRDAKERQNAEQTHKQTKGVSRLSAATEGKKCQSPQNVCDSAARVHVCDPPGIGVEAESLAFSFERDLNSARPLLQLIAAGPKHAALVQIR